ncbi:MAG: NAD-dependent epimerase/dehydratase family protein [Clostridia bacterium]|nr:NAD-dependent epimerase/dehydratase family protein [Clostridia bacterium]
MNSKYKILIIGGSGFLSGTLAKLAVSLGHDVWITTRGKKQIPEGVNLITADRHDKPAFKNAVEETGIHWDAVFDCICFHPDDAKQDIEVFKNRTNHLIWISTDFVYNPQKRWFPQNEQNLHFLTDGSYGALKRLCELEFMSNDLGQMVVTTLRPAHIYGPGSYLGCLPQHSRDPELIFKIINDQPLCLVGGGHFLQQPIFANDLAELMISCIGNEKTYNEIFCVMGPDIIESRKYYQIIASYLGKHAHITEISIHEFLESNHDSGSFLCHRIYDLSKLKMAGLKIPSTSIYEGLEKHVKSLL